MLQSWRVPFTCSNRGSSHPGGFFRFGAHRTRTMNLEETRENRNHPSLTGVVQWKGLRPVGGRVGRGHCSLARLHSQRRKITTSVGSTNPILQGICRVKPDARTLGRNRLSLRARPAVLPRVVRPKAVKTSCQVPAILLYRFRRGHRLHDANGGVICVSCRLRCSSCQTFL